MTTDPIRLLIVDDHTLFREGLLAIFLSVNDIEIVGEAASGEEAIEQAQTLQPDVILMDVQMSPVNGIDATRHILETLPATRVIMLTMIEDSDSLFAAMVAGAKSYVLKGADKAEVLKTIRTVASGEVLFGPAIASRMTDFFRNLDANASPSNAAKPFPDLTDREREVLDLIARGMSNHDIARQLHVAVKTVSNHISNVFNKLHVADRAQAIIKARDAGLGRDNNH